MLPLHQRSNGVDDRGRTYIYTICSRVPSHSGHIDILAPQDGIEPPTSKLTVLR